MCTFQSRQSMKKVSLRSWDGKTITVKKVCLKFLGSEVLLKQLVTQSRCLSFYLPPRFATRKICKVIEPTEVN